jgi:hypothetical protein
MRRVPPDIRRDQRFGNQSRVIFWNTMRNENFHAVVDEVVGGKAVFFDGGLNGI